MSYIVPMDKPTECRRCPFCDPYGYDCRLQRDSDKKSFDEQIRDCPLTDIDPLTDPEQRIFLAALGREEKICKEVDQAHPEGVGLMALCRSIRRKVKGALWRT